jgi:hypothetical protein
LLRPKLKCDAIDSANFPRQGWRKSQQKTAIAKASNLILGAIWARWRLPLFFIKDMYHYGQGVWSSGFCLFMIVVFPTAVYTMDLQQHAPQHACGNPFSFRVQFYL